MPRKPKPTLAVVTATVTLAVPDGVFGGSVTAIVTGPVPEYCYVHYACQAATGGQIGQALVDPATGEATLTFGPTPSWSSGEADGWAYVQYYDLSTTPDYTIVVISDTVAFHVAA